MKEKEMTENEIMNFAYDFTNLIKRKNADICELKNEIKNLREQIRMESPVVLAKEEVGCITCPVWVVPINRFPINLSKRGFYALPVNGGVRTAQGGLYRLDNYNKTWVAYSTRPDLDISTL